MIGSFRTTAMEARLTAARSNEGNEHKSGDVASNCSNALPSPHQELEQLEQLEKIKHDASADALSFSLQLTEMKEHHQTQLKQTSN